MTPYEIKKRIIREAIDDYVIEHGMALFARTGIGAHCLIKRYLRVILSDEDAEDFILYRDGFEVPYDEISERVSYVISSLLRITDED